VTEGSRGRPGALYGIADAGLLGEERLESGVVEMAEAGLETIQIRAKAVADRTLFRICEELVERLQGWPGQLWIDDRVDLAALLPLAGVHLGQNDLPAARARQMLPAKCAIGGSTHDERQMVDGDAEPAIDWLAFGPIFDTSSKADPDPPVGLDALRRLRKRTGKPLIAIGGLREEHLPRVLDAGADSAAVLSEICNGNVGENSRRLLRAIAGR
jgi:thiamine-phosphate pyrophosphorylase